MERHGLSQRHACRLVGLDRSTLRYQRQRPDDAAVRQRLRDLVAERRRFGYRRLGWMLAREGHAMNHKDCIGCTTKRSSWCAGVGDASARWEHGRR
jgi:hypothetical protein